MFCYLRLCGKLLIYAPVKYFSDFQAYTIYNSHILNLLSLPALSHLLHLNKTEFIFIPVLTFRAKNMKIKKFVKTVINSSCKKDLKAFLY